MNRPIARTKPKLTKAIDLTIFETYYWLKTELIDFCKKQGLSSKGSKEELTGRIEVFIRTGVRSNPPTKKTTGNRDSEKPITLKTPVIHYKNDAPTRGFFVQHIGPRFHFTAYLRQFGKKIIKRRKPLTYGELVKGWLAEEARKKNPHYQTHIDKQFEYNRFIRDFFASEAGKSRNEAIQAWKIVRAIPGPNTYSYFKSIKQ